MTTEVADDTKKTSSRKRKQTSEEQTVERKTNPRRAAKTKAEEAKAAAAATSASTSKTKTTGTKKAKTEKADTSLPALKNFMKVQDLKVVISYPSTEKEEEHEETSSKKDAEDEKDKTNEEETTKNGDAATNNQPAENEPLYTLIAKPQKSYGWSATVPKAKIKVEIDGEECEKETIGRFMFLLQCIVTLVVFVLEFFLDGKYFFLSLHQLLCSI
ncbi:hypothetical protein GLOIN_2v1627940 [Rhizophagus clarus]|uniref:Uncharacterized protein n=1 Tax=Rhizophagus clarus TaxID=94130 RepID=A0A8H3KQY5_9GLOM|nr:hypothetical protein GLOIN_2v1627940 [Rhizophagus clarus]